MHGSTVIKCMMLGGVFCKTLVSRINDKIARTKKRRRPNLVGTGELTMGLGPVARAGYRLQERWVEGEEKMGRLGSVPQAGLGWRRLQLGLGGAADEAKQGPGQCARSSARPPARSRGCRGRRQRWLRAAWDSGDGAKEVCVA